MKAPALFRHINGALAILALVAVLARGLIPTGYMVGPSADGSVTVTICGSSQTAQLDLATGVISHGAPGHHGDSKSTEHPPCLFAASAVMAQALSSAPVVLASVHNTTLALSAAPAHVGQGLAAPPPPARGPPLTA